MCTSFNAMSYKLFSSKSKVWQIYRHKGTSSVKWHHELKWTCRNTNPLKPRPTASTVATGMLLAHRQLRNHLFVAQQSNYILLDMGISSWQFSTVAWSIVCLSDPTYSKLLMKRRNPIMTSESYLKLTHGQTLKIKPAFTWQQLFLFAEVVKPI